jgi:hypothetical protein
VDALVIPVPPPATPARHAEVYKARRGDTLVKIADRFGVSLDDLHRWNHDRDERGCRSAHSRDGANTSCRATSRDRTSISGSKGVPHMRARIVASKSGNLLLLPPSLHPSCKSRNKAISVLRQERAIGIKARKSGESMKTANATITRASARKIYRSS